MKLAIITLYDYYNYGSYLQAWAMQEYLKSLGNNVFFVKTQNLRRRLRRGFNSHNKLLFDAKKELVFQKDFFYLHQISKNELTNHKIDGVIIGSDELWNADNDAFNQYPFYYGIGYEKIPTLVYAMSLGNGDYNTLQKKKYAAEGIKNLQNIYARDKNTADAIGQVCGRKIDLVCDPTLLIEKERYLFSKEKSKKERYILIYSYDMPAFLQEHIQKIAADKDLKIISACFQTKCADRVVNCNPLSFPRLVVDAEIVVTSTFHGSLFSVLFNKQLVVLPYAKKTIDFLRMLHLERVIIEENCLYERFKKAIENPIDYSDANKKIMMLQQKSRKILNDFLEDSLEKVSREGSI